MESKKKVIKECEVCGVPEHLHNTCCGWENASLIMLSDNDNINIDGDEKKRRWEFIKNQTENNFIVS